MRKNRNKDLDDPYLDDLKDEFRQYSSELKKLKQKLLKSSSPQDQTKIIKKMDAISTKMENNQKQSTKVTKSRLKEMKKTRKK
jgi:sugar-specific transcriptional regulator TrmB